MFLVSNKSNCNFFKDNMYYFVTTIILLIYSFLVSYKYVLSTGIILLVVIAVIMFNFPKKIVIIAILFFTTPIDNLTTDIGGLGKVVFFHKALILIGVTVYIMFYGRKKNVSYIPIWCSVIIFILSLTLSTRLMEYKMSDLITAYFGYILGWIFFYVEWQDRLKNLYIISLLPLISLGIGCILNVVHIWEMFQHIDSIRLQGATIPPHLAMIALMGMVSALTLGYLDKTSKRKWYFTLLVINFLIILATQTRGAMFGALVIIFLVSVDYIKRSYKQNKFITFESTMLILGLIIAILLFAVLMVSRTLSGEDTINTSGRFDAWTNYLYIGSVNMVFGIGFGAVKTIKGVDINNCFSAAHNEYLRFFVEGGIVGFILIIISFICVFKQVIKNNIIKKPRFIMPSLIIAFLIFSFTDNTISAVEFWVLFCWYLGLIHDKEIKN